MLKQLRQEQQRGWWEPEVALEDIVTRFNNEFCLLLYFGIQQGKKVRGCVDPAEVSTLSALLETTYMSSLDGIINVLQEIRAAWGPIDLLFFKEDWEAGFRTLNLKLEHRRFFVAAAESEQGQVVCCVPVKLLLGPSRCPPQFSRVSEAFERLQTEFLWIVTNHHVDDHIAFETPELVESARVSIRRFGQNLANSTRGKIRRGDTPLGWTPLSNQRKT